MRQFILQVISFSLIVCSIICITFFVSNSIILNNTKYDLPKNVDKIVIGHSHPECAYNDSLIDNFYNMASSANSYFYNFYTLKPLLENNKNLTTVFLEFTNNQIDTNMSRWIWADKYLPYKFQSCGSFIDKEGLSLLFKKNPSGLLNGYMRLLGQNMKIIASSNYSYLNKRGGYKYLKRDKLDKAIKLQQELVVNPKKSSELSYYNLLYLEKIISLCKDKDIELYLVRTPMHHLKVDSASEKKFQEIRINKFNDVEFLDFKEFDLLDTDFGDLEHLNYRGARAFSLGFNFLLKNGLLDSTNKQKIIDEYE